MKNENLNFMKMFLTLQDIATDKNETIKQKVKRKERIFFATKGIIKPQNWETLPDKEKLKRMNKAQNNL
tara:strand:+ start:646 stop:852 length:207 start_codon:yes stop_codon:yes gene_type:complete